MGIVLQLWFWFTPVVYLMTNMPKRFITVLNLNPMTAMVKIYQNALLYGAVPGMADLLVPALISSGMFIFSFWIFRRASADLVDAL
jgi:lipopolysaccharide transport system permease protein